VSPLRRAAAPADERPVVAARTAGHEALLAERRRLAEEVAERTWDLGGLTYEMAVRDHFRPEVLARRAAELQVVDARLSEVERLLADHAGIGGHCRFCGSPHGRSAEFCWSCGERLMTRVPAVIDVAPTPSDAVAHERATAEHPAVGRDA
jgi:chorismate mutase